MANAGTLTVTLQAVSQKFTAGMKSAGASLAAFKGALGPVNAAIGSLTGALSAARFIQVAGQLDQLGDSAERLGVSVQSLSRLNYAASQSGMFSGSMEMALDRLSRQALLASDGNEKLQGSFRILGVSAEQFLAMNPEDRFSVFADAINKVDDPARRSALAMKLLGNNTSDMMELLAKGSGGVEKLGQEADRLGISINSNLKQVEKFNEEMTKLGAVFKGAEMKIVITLAPHVNDALDLLLRNKTGSGITGQQRQSGMTDLDGGYARGQAGLPGANPKFMRGFNSWLFRSVYDSQTEAADRLEKNSAVPFYSAKKINALPERGFADSGIAGGGGGILATNWAGIADKIGGSVGRTLSGTLTNAQQMGKGAGSQMSWLGGAYMTAQRMQQQGAANQRERASSLFEHFKGNMGENNLLKRGTREAWMAERKGAQDKEQINLLKGIEKACAELARRGVTLATLD